MSSAPTPAPPLQLHPQAAAALDHLVHAMGQPLTILQSCALVRLRPLPSLEEAEAFVAEMAGEVDRLTHLYRSLRDLVENASRPAVEIAKPGSAREEISAAEKIAASV